MNRGKIFQVRLIITRNMEKNMDRHIYLKNVSTLQVDEDKCIGCGMCLAVCPHEVLRLEQKRVQLANRDACMECGACARNCPAEAIFVKTGVGCAAAVINSALGRKQSACSCTIETSPTCGEGLNKNLNPSNRTVNDFKKGCQIP